MYCASYHFFFRVEKEAGLGVDEFGNNDCIYTSMSMDKCMKALTEKEYEVRQEVIREIVANMLDIEDIKLVTPIDRDEYQYNTEDEEGEEL